MRGLMAKPSAKSSKLRLRRTSAKVFTGAAVLHLDARRPQRSGGYRSEDGGFRISSRAVFVDVAQDVIISEGRLRHGGRHFRRFHRGSGEIIEPLRDRIRRPSIARKIKDLRRQVIVEINQEITEDLARRFKPPVSSA
jgi:hypothetical protein